MKKGVYTAQYIFYGAHDQLDHLHLDVDVEHVVAAHFDLKKCWQWIDFQISN
jgi:hypothetical protein